MSYSRRQLYAMGEPIGDSATYRKVDGGLILGDGGGSSAPAQTTQTQVVDLPDWAKGYAQDTLAKGQALSQQPYQAYGGERVAGLSPLQQQAMATVASPEAFGKQVQGYMSPYQQAVTDIQKREAGRQAGILGTQQAAQATGAGAFGGYRQGIQSAERERNLMQQMNDIQAQGSQSAFNAATQQANLATQQQAQLGALQQQQAQRPLDIAYQDFLAQKNYPYQQLSYMGNLIRGTPMGMSSQSQVYQGAPSAVQTLGALGMGAYGMSKLMAEGGVAGYADGGMTVLDKFNDPEAMLPDMSKLNMDQLRAIIETPATPAEKEAAQRELAMRASEDRGMAAAYNQLPYSAQQGMVQAAGGGIIAFAQPTAANNYSLVDSDGEGSDGGDSPLANLTTSRGDPGIYRDALSQALAYGKQVGEFEPRGMTEAQYNTAIQNRYKMLQELGGPSPYAAFEQDLGARETDRAKAREEAKGLAALQAIPAILQPGGTIRGLGAAAASIGGSMAKAAEADRAEKQAIQNMKFNIADAQRKERMGLGREAITAADQARRDVADINRAHIQKLQAQATIAGRVAQAAKPTGGAGGAGSAKEFIVGPATYLPAIKKQFPGLSDEEHKAMAFERYQQNKSAGLPGVVARTESGERTKAAELAGKRRFTDTAWLEANKKKDKSALAARESELFADELKKVQAGGGGGAGGGSGDTVGRSNW